MGQIVRVRRASHNPTLRHHDCRCRRQGCLQSQACPQEDDCLQGSRRCRCCWQEGSWILQAARQGAQGQEAQGCQEAQEEACCQEAQEGCQEACRQEAQGRQEACCQEAQGCQEACCQEARS